MRDIDLDRLTPAQKAVYEEILQSPRGVVEGPLRIWVNNPELARRAQQLGAYCRFGSSLSGHLSELAIVTVGAHWRSGFEWAVHAPIARSRGISAAAIEDIRRGRTPDLDQADERVVYQFTTELLEQKAVSQGLYEAATACLGETAVIDLVGIIGYYGFICATINAFQVQVPEGAADPFR